MTARAMDACLECLSHTLPASPNIVHERQQAHLFLQFHFPLDTEHPKIASTVRQCVLEDLELASAAPPCHLEELPACQQDNDGGGHSAATFAAPTCI